MVIFCISLISNSSLHAREQFEFSIGDNVQILSDKAFRRSKENKFEAVGNVIITHQTNAIYGEKATLSFTEGDAEVVGNVRYVGATMTMYGSKLFYNFNNHKLSIHNARILSDNYVVLGKRLSRISKNEIHGVDAEYTTCRDCPESWSVFGREVKITLGEYIRIKHAYIKVKGVVVMYVPYIILPIKKNRETGLLFPSFGFDLQEGARFQQPWFWAITQSADLTLTPSFFGKRGVGNELEYRQVLTDGLWFEVGGMQVRDKVYEPFKDEISDNGKAKYRHYSEWEHHYFSGRTFNHHFYYNNVSDLDIGNDYGRYIGNRLSGTEYGGGGFFEINQDLFSLGLESYFNKNILFSNPSEFDDRYVQILPKVSFSSTPIRIFQTETPGFNKFTFFLEGDYSVFKQNKIQESSYIRNAKRINANPTLEWHFGRLGPVLGKTKATFDYQHYRFPTQLKQPSFTKSGVVYETEFSLELEKIFGLSYQSQYPAEMVRKKNEKTEDNQIKDIIGNIPSSVITNKEFVTVKKNSYRHSQVFKLKHYFLSDQKFKGNSRWLDQIRKEEGQFDPVDAIREKEFLLSNEESRTSLPLNNTVEFQWNNSLIKKKANSFNLLADNKSIRNNFTFEKVSYFNISQGYDFNLQEGDFIDHLTRLFVETGFNIKKFRFSLTEYYYYTTQENILTISLDKGFERFSLGASFRYDSFRTPIDKFFILNTSIQLSDLISVTTRWEYDIEVDATQKSNYGVVYSPYNNCWRFALDYEKTITDKKFSFNFLINFNENNFTSLSGAE